MKQRASRTVRGFVSIDFFISPFTKGYFEYTQHFFIFVFFSSRFVFHIFFDKNLIFEQKGDKDDSKWIDFQIKMKNEIGEKELRNNQKNMITSYECLLMPGTVESRARAYRLYIFILFMCYWLCSRESVGMCVCVRNPFRREYFWFYTYVHLWNSIGLFTRRSDR